MVRKDPTDEVPGNRAAGLSDGEAPHTTMSGWDRTYPQVELDHGGSKPGRTSYVIIYANYLLDKEART